jgi:hypothetical protein
MPICHNDETADACYSIVLLLVILEAGAALCEQLATTEY